MKVAEISESMVGKKVECMCTGAKCTGTISSIVEDVYSKGFHIILDKPVRWGDDIYTEYDSTARKCDDFGNLKYTNLI